MHGAWRSAWEAALDELELTLEAAERLLRGEMGGEPAAEAAWTPPHVDGPPPQDLMPRVRLLLARQQDVIRRTTSSAAEVRRQIVLLDRVAAARPARRERHSAYLDVTV